LVARIIQTIYIELTYYPYFVALNGGSKVGGNRAALASEISVPSNERDILKMAGNDVDDRYKAIPDIRDGLTREERVVLYVLHQTQMERGGRNVPTAMLWGRVCEHLYVSPEELSLMLARLGASNTGDNWFRARDE
jgi:hypothetical protein